MSRSYKNTPVFKPYSRLNSKWYKRQAGKKVRRADYGLGKSKRYRKIFETWDICDYRFYEVMPDSSETDACEHWKKFYRRK